MCWISAKIYLMAIAAVFSFIGLKTSLAQPHKRDSLQLYLQKKELSDRNKVDAYLALAEDYNKIGSRDSIAFTKYATMALKLSDDIGYVEGKINVLDIVCQDAYYYGLYQKLDSVSLLCLQYARAHQNEYGESVAHYYRGIFYISTGHWINAINSFSLAKTYFATTNHPEWSAKIISHLGDTYNYQGDIAQSLECHMEALNIKREAGIEDIVVGLIRVGHAISKLKQININHPKEEDELKYFNEAVSVARKIGNAEKEAAASMVVAKYHLQNGNYRKGLEIALSVEENIENSKIPSNIIWIKEIIGGLYVELGEYEKGIQIMNEALTLAQEMGHVTVILRNLRTLGLYCLKQSDFQSAKAYAMQAYERAEAFNYLNTLQIASEIIYKSEEALGNHAAALKYLKLNKEHSDSLLNEADIKKMAKLETAHEYQKKTDSTYYANEKEKLILNQNLAAQRKSNIIFLVGISISIVFSIVLFLFIRTKNKANILLKKKNEEIDRQKKELESMNEMKSRFFANIAHELRTPLTLVSGPFHEILKSLSPDSSKEIQQNVKLLNKNIDQLRRLVNDILDLSRIESNKMDLDLRNVSAHVLINRTWNNFQSLAKIQKIDYSLDVENLTPMIINVDIHKVEKIINNLLSNALKFTKAGQSVKMVVSNEEDLLKVKVIDTGIGIKKDELPHVFNRYYQGNQTGVSQIQSSTGIGLALCREFSDLMRGRVTASSTFGEGSTFYFEMPIPITQKLDSEKKIDINNKKKKLENSEIKKSNSTPIPIQKNMFLEKKGNILLVEDHRDIHDFIFNILNEKYQVTSAYNGKEGLLETKKTYFDLIISDLLMTELDGYEMLKDISTQGLNKNTPKIVLTALNEDKHKLNVSKLGITDFITKPFSPDYLRARVDTLIKTKSTQENEQPV